MTLRKVCLMLLCVFLAAGAQAREYRAGDVVVGLGAVSSALELGTDWGEVNVEDQTANISHDAKLGKPGVGGELQVLYFIHPRVAAGVSFQDQYFAQDLASGWYVNMKTRQRNYMAVGRVFLTPEATYKLYIPLAVGAADTDMTVDFGPKEHFRYTGFAYYAGIGVERLLGEHWGLGFEIRYNGNKFHDSKTTATGDHVVVYPKTNYISTVLRANYRI